MNQIFSLPVLLPLTLICVSLVLWIQAVASWRRGQDWMQPLGFPRFDIQPRMNLAGFVLGFLIFPALLQQFLGDDPDQQVFRIQMLNLFRCVFVILWSCVQRLTVFRQAPLDPLVSPPLNVTHSLRIGIWGFFFSFLPIWLLLMVVAGYREDHPLIQLLQNPSTSLWVTVIVTAVVVAPFFEELLFRVMLLPALRQLLDPWQAIFISSAIFAISHSPVDAIPLLPLALVLGYVYHRTGSYAAVIAMHALFNAFNLYLFWSQPPMGKVINPD